MCIHFRRCIILLSVHFYKSTVNYQNHCAHRHQNALCIQKYLCTIIKMDCASKNNVVQSSKWIVHSKMMLRNHTDALCILPVECTIRKVCCTFINMPWAIEMYYIEVRFDVLLKNFNKVLFYCATCYTFCQFIVAFNSSSLGPLFKKGLNFTFSIFQILDFISKTFVFGLERIYFCWSNEEKI